MYLISDGGFNTNTLDTIESVMLTKNNKNIDGVKLDVRVTFDNIFVIARYEELDIFTYARGNISDYNYSFIRKIKFPSHIFKYFIPTLEEILNKYNNKIIVLEIYNINNLDLLYILLIKYNYIYYFISKDNNIINKLNELEFNKLGKVISYNDILKSITNNDLYDNTFLIKD